MEPDDADSPLLPAADLGNILGTSHPGGNEGTSVSVLPSSTKAPKFRQILATSMSLLAPLSFGLVLGYSSPTLAALQDEKIIDEKTETWYVSIPTLGALLGAVVGGFFVAKMGRRGTLLALGVPFVCAWLMITAVSLNKSYYLLLLGGRFLSGASMGVVCIAGPNYIAEIASPDMRGALVTMFQVATAAGVFLAFAIGIPLNWQWLALVCAAIATAMSVLMFFVPETPRYLAAEGLDLEALASLRWLRGNSFDIEEEYEGIKEQIARNQDVAISCQEFTKKSVYKPIILTLCLMIFQQWSGVNDIMFYTTEIFKSAKFEGNPAIPGVVVGAVQLVATMGSVFVIDRLGRRILLAISGTFMSVGCVMLGVNYYLQEHNSQTNLPWLPICSLVLYMAAFSVGWGSIPWTMMAELIPSRVKGFASGLSVVVNWTSAFLVTKEFKDMEDTMTTYGTFWFFAGINALGVVFVLLLLPETKGKSLEEIERLFSDDSQAELPSAHLE